MAPIQNYQPSLQSHLALKYHPASRSPRLSVSDRTGESVCRDLWERGGSDRGLCHLFPRPETQHWLRLSHDQKGTDSSGGLRDATQSECRRDGVLSCLQQGRVALGSIPQPESQHSVSVRGRRDHLGAEASGRQSWRRSPRWHLVCILSLSPDPEDRAGGAVEERGSGSSLCGC